MQVTSGGRHGTALGMLLAIALVLLFHGAALDFAFLWDDFAWLDNFHRHDLVTLLKDDALTNTLVSYYRPLVALSLSLQLAVSQSAQHLHAFNLALHAINLCLVVLIARQVAPQTGYRLPLVITALAIHPVLVEPVVWISGRFDLFFTSFLLLSVLAALRMRAGMGRWLTVSLCFLAALGCKESALAYVAVGPVLLATLERDARPCSERDWWRAMTRHAVALMPALATYLVLRVGVLELPLVKHTAFQAQGAMDLGAHLVLVLRTFGTYLQMSVLPLWNLAPLHAVTDDPNTLLVYAAAGALALMLALAGLRWPLFLPTTVWSLALLPAANLVPFRLDLVQGRYLYFPLFAAALCALSTRCALRTAPRLRPGLMALTAAWLLAMAVTTHSIVPLWRDGVALFSWVVSMRPASRYALENLAMAHFNAQQYRQAIDVESRIAPPARSFQGWLVLARAQRDSGELAVALESFTHALTVPAYDDGIEVSATYELALLHRTMGDSAASARVARQAEALAASRHVSTRLRDYYRQALRGDVHKP
ncbi:MAG: hypothetical protein IT492_13075 [Gammaproteobacteria bacterium]|nr:hypothetical protein [Gammaproteobacteria bacterium]